MLKHISTIPDLEELIRRSHARSQRYGVDPCLDGAPESARLPKAALNKRIKGQQEFFDLARAQIDTLYGLLKGTGFCMALADSQGYVLHVVGDPELVEHFKRRRCLPATVGWSAIWAPAPLVWLSKSGCRFFCPARACIRPRPAG